MPEAMFWSGGPDCTTSGRGPSRDCPCQGCREYIREVDRLDGIHTSLSKLFGCTETVSQLALGAVALGLYAIRER